MLITSGCRVRIEVSTEFKHRAEHLLSKWKSSFNRLFQVCTVYGSLIAKNQIINVIQASTVSLKALNSKAHSVECHSCRDKDIYTPNTQVWILKIIFNLIFKFINFSCQIIFRIFILLFVYLSIIKDIFLQQEFLVSMVAITQKKSWASCCLNLCYCL